MTELLTAAQMRAIEQAAIASGETTGLELMERAGAGVVEAILEEWPDMAKSPQKAVVLCGPGNNGGDGFVVARLLKTRGWAVEVFLYGEVKKLPPDANVNAERWLDEGGIIQSSAIAHSDELYYARYDLFVDAVFGTGLSRGLPDSLGPWIFFAHDNQSPRDQTKTVSIDIASGICADSGRAIGRAGVILPKLTVTFQKPKLGHYLGEGASYTRGRYVKVVNIGVPANSVSGSGITTLASEVAMVSRLSKAVTTHKYAHGHALILSGPATRTGAARLAARGALRVGAGVVSLGCPQAAALECAAQLTAIMLAPIEDGAALVATLQDKRINALCLGPALGVDDRGRGLLDVALGGVEPHPTVLDADALTILSEAPALFAKLHKNCVLTPHAGEFKRLFPDIAAKLEAPATTGPAYSKVDATREAAARAGCVVLFKGADTVIAAPDGRAAINSAHYERAVPWLATAGSGDVLAGFITGLLARGFAPMQAAETAAWLHVECALKFGPGLIAEDIPEQLPSVFRDLQL